MRMQINKDRLLPLTNEKKIYTYLIFFLVALVTFVTGTIAKFDGLEAVKAIPGIISFIVVDFMPPSPAALPHIWVPLLDTLYMAIVSTITGAIISFILSLLCASPTAHNRQVQLVVRALVSLLRNIPSLAWALILVPAFGIGKFVGLIALLLGSIGNMTRFFTEAIEEIDLEGVEAIRSVGASWIKVVKCAVLPQCTPSIVSWTLYNLELNIRASTIIGMVGGGGIGMYIQSTVKLFRYDRACMAILIVGVAVILLEYGSNKIRERIL